MYKPPRRREQLRSANWNWTRHYIHGYCVILWCLKNLSWMPSTCGLTHPLCNYSGGHQSHGYCMILWCWGVPIGNNWSWMPSTCGLTHLILVTLNTTQVAEICLNDLLNQNGCSIPRQQTELKQLKLNHGVGHISKINQLNFLQNLNRGLLDPLFS